MGNYSTAGNCTVINDLKDGLWSIDYCSNQYYFACQKPQGFKKKFKFKIKHDIFKGNVLKDGFLSRISVI